MEPKPTPTEDHALTHRSLLITSVFASVVILLIFVWYLVDVLLLVFAGVLFAIILRTPADWLSRRTGIAAPWTLTFVILFLVALVGTAVVLFGNAVADQMGQLVRKVPEIVNGLMERLEQYNWLLNQIRPQELLSDAPQFLGKGFRVISTTFGAIAGFVIVIVLGIFFAIQPGLYVQGVVQLVSQRRRKRTKEVLHSVGHILRWWLFGQLMLMLTVGLITGIGLWLLDVPLALALGVLTGLLNFVPYLGPIFAAVPAVLVALAESPVLAGYVLLLYFGVQSIEGYVLEPVVQRKAVYLPPALILLAQIVLGILVGILGVMFATPVAAALMVTVKMLYVEDVLGGKGT